MRFDKVIHKTNIAGSTFKDALNISACQKFSIYIKTRSLRIQKPNNFSSGAAYQKMNCIVTTIQV